MHEKEYFCGWYFKCQSEEESIALIPAVHMAEGVQTCSIQFICGNDSWNVSFPGTNCEECLVRRDKPYAKIGKSLFSDKGIRLDLHTESLDVTGWLRFGKASPIRYDIMGPFCFIPFMECRHSVSSMSHEVNGRLTVNGKIYRFKNALGYIEGDRGYSFPKRYLWTHTFFEGGSLMLSVAEIPLGTFHFIGVIGVVVVNGREYRLATYLGARVVRLRDGEVIVRQGKWILRVKLLDQRSHPLKAPTGGAMTRTIHENIVCQARYQFRKSRTILLDLETTKASFEWEY